MAKGSNAPAGRKATLQYEYPDLWRSVWALVNSFVPFCTLWYLMYLSLSVSYWLTLGLAVLAAGFYIRLFIIFHDCGHGSFFKSMRANNLVGMITGVITFTPYFRWRHDHAVHHATAGNLEKRGVGDIKTLTVQEYLDLHPLKKLAYRAYRHPVVLLVIGPVVQFLIIERFVARGETGRERSSVYWTNAALVAVATGLSLLVGFKAFVLVTLPIIWIAGAAGVWLFYVQHQFEDTVWERPPNWDFAHAALHGSSYLRLPKILDWFTGSIGYHHIHHLSPRVPHYRLAKCHEENAVLQVRPITLIDGIRALGLALWDEEKRKLVGFSAVRRSRLRAAS